MLPWPTARVWYGMEPKFRYGIWKIPEWNGMEDFKNGMEDNLPYFHNKSMLYISCMVYTEKIYTNVGSDKHSHRSTQHLF